MVTSSVPTPAPPSRYGGRERPRLIVRFGSSTLPSRPFLRAAHEAAKHASPKASIWLHRQRGAGAGERAPAVTPRAVAPCDPNSFAPAVTPPPAKSWTRVPGGQDEPPSSRSPRSPASPRLKKARVKPARRLAAERQQREATAAAERDRRDALALLDAQRLVEVETKAPMAPTSLLPQSAACLLPCAW